MKDYIYIYIVNTQKAFFSENYIIYINIYLIYKIYKINILFLYENENFLDKVLDKSIISKASYLFKLIFRITISFPNLNNMLHYSQWYLRVSYRDKIISYQLVRGWPLSQTH